MGYSDDKEARGVYASWLLDPGQGTPFIWKEAVMEKHARVSIIFILSMTKKLMILVAFQGLISVRTHSEDVSEPSVFGAWSSAGAGG